MTHRDLDVLVVGGGAFGTALGHLLAVLGRRVLVWVRRAELAEEINTRHTNARYLDGFSLSPALEAGCELGPAVRRARVVLLVVPTRAVREVARELGDHLTGDQVLLHAVKGLEVSTFSRVSEILREETCALKIGVLSGPNLAHEILKGRPAGALVASRFDEVVVAAQGLFAGGWLRLFGGSDVVGTEIAAAFKNIVAIASGIVDGLELGDNTKALLVTLGLGEMARLGVSMGADVFTFGGLAGIGDLMATCASRLSRNHQVGERLGRGERLDDILAGMVHVAEGVPTTQAVRAHCARVGQRLPIVEAVHAVLFEGRAIEQALRDLMALPVTRELAALRYR